MIEKQADGVATLKNLSPRDFLNFGLHQVAYIKEVRVEGKTGFMIHAADGTPLSMMDTADTAISLVRHNDLEAVTVH